MKIQLQTNCATRGITQNTNKAETFAKPNFAGTGQVSVPVRKGLEGLIKSFAEVFRKHNPTAILEGIDTAEGFHFAKASFEPKKDVAVLKSLTDFMEKAEKEGNNQFNIDYTTGQHCLNEEELKRIDFTPKYKSGKEVAKEDAEAAFVDGFIAFVDGFIK